MGRTGKVEFGRVFACVFVIGAHLVFWWMLTRKIALPEPVDEADEALQLTWIEPPKPLVLPIPAAAPDDPRPAPTPVRKPPVRATTPEATPAAAPVPARSEEHTSELQSLMRISYAVFCLNKKNI